jgi:hypothetical protein
MCETCGAHFRDRQTAGGEHQIIGSESAVVGLNLEFIGFGNAFDVLLDADVDIPRCTFGQQHLDYIAGGMVAEQLAEGFFVVWDLMFIDQGDEVVLRIRFQSGFAEMRVLRKEPVMRGVQIGKIAAPTAGDKDFGTHPIGMIQQQYTLSTLPSAQGAHEASGARPQNNDV